MYKFAPKEEIPLDTNVPEALPNIIIPSDVPIFPPGGLYPGLDPRSVPSMLGAAGIPELPGYSDTGSAWPVYSSALPVVSGYGGTSRSGELVVRILCPSNTIGRVIGKGGSSIKNVRQASGACVDVDDTKANRGECIITVTSTEVRVFLCPSFFFSVDFVFLYLYLKGQLDTESKTRNPLLK